MKNIKYLSFIGILFFAAFYACDPMEELKPDAGLVIPPDQVNFSVSQGEDEFHFVLKNNTPVTGGITNTKWKFENGKPANAVGDEVIVKYGKPGTYAITMTIGTNGGSISTTDSLTQTEEEIIEDPMVEEIALTISGGPDNPNGVVWVVDSLADKHLGVGQTDLYEPNWWSAGPLGKSGHYLYDDEFTFVYNGFQYLVDTHGSTHANGDGGAADRGLAAGYYTSVIWEDNFDKDVATNDAARGDMNWDVSVEDGKYYINLSVDAAVLSYDDSNPRSYEILSWDENLMHLRSSGGAARYHKLIRKGYVAAFIDFDLTATATAETNNYNFGVENVEMSDGESIDKVVYDFGNGESYETEDLNEVVNYTYMRKGTYTASAKAMTSMGEIVKTASVTIDAHHPDYEEFILDMMVMYVDHSEIEINPLVGEDCSLEVVDNPNAIYPNKGQKVAFYSKTNNEWANANMKLPAGHRFDLRQQSTFRLMVYGKAGDVVLLKLENTDKGGAAWETGTELTYTIQQDNTWELAEYDFKGASSGFDWLGNLIPDVTDPDAAVSNDFYDIIRIMLNPGVGEGTHEFYLDDLAGPHVEGLKSGSIK